MSDAKTPTLPPLVGTLLTLPPHVQEVVMGYGAACARMATRDARARIATLEEREQFLLAATRDAQDHAAAYGEELLAARSAPPSHEGPDARDALLLREARAYVESASTMFYDGTNGDGVRKAARDLLARIDRAARAGGSQ